MIILQHQNSSLVLYMCPPCSRSPTCALEFAVILAPRRPVLGLSPDAAPNLKHPSRPPHVKLNRNRIVRLPRPASPRAYAPAPNRDVHSPLRLAPIPLRRQRRPSPIPCSYGCCVGSGNETSKYNGCNIHLKAVETLMKHLKTHLKHT
jgi:hypothetical protein